VARQKIKKRATPQPQAAPWERQPGEPEAAWGSFVAYRDLGPLKRSLAEVGRLLGGKSRQNFDRMSARWQWVERVRAWDAEQDRVRRETHLEELRDMTKRHAQLSMLAQTAGFTTINRLLKLDRARTMLAEGKGALAVAVELKLAPSEVERLGVTREDPLPAKVAATLIEMGIKNERLARGEPSVVEENRLKSESFADLIRRAVDRDPRA
jgi:hypothetical protein